jgi:hypothetical protein
MHRSLKNGGEIETLPTIPRFLDIQRRYKLRQLLAGNAAAKVR